MNSFLIALIIGLAAGIIDVIPIIIQKLDKRILIHVQWEWVSL